MANSNEKEWYRNIRQKYSNLNPITFKFNMDDERQAGIYNFLIRCDDKRSGGHRKKKLVMAALENVMSVIGNDPSIEDVDAVINGGIRIGSLSISNDSSRQATGQDNKVIGMYVEMVNIAAGAGKTMSITLDEFTAMDSGRQRGIYESTLAFSKNNAPQHASGPTANPDDAPVFTADDDGIINVDL